MNILDKIDFDYEVSENQQNLFTPYHTRFDITICYNNKEYTTEYQCNTQYCYPEKMDVLDSLLLDKFCYDADDFCTDGMSASEVVRIYNACKETSEALSNMFTEDELEALALNIYA